VLSRHRMQPVWVEDVASLFTAAVTSDEAPNRTFEWLEDELPGEFTFEVLWGDEPIDKLVSREELVRIVRTGHLGGRTRYRVMPH